MLQYILKKNKNIHFLNGTVGTTVGKIVTNFDGLEPIFVVLGHFCTGGKEVFIRERVGGRAGKVESIRRNMEEIQEGFIIVQICFKLERKSYTGSDPIIIKFLYSPQSPRLEGATGIIQR